MIKRTRRFPFVFLTTATYWRPTTAPNGRSGPASLSLFRKVTYCFRSGWGAELYTDILSVIETGRRRALDASRLTLAGKPLAPPVP